MRHIKHILLLASLIMFTVLCQAANCADISSIAVNIDQGSTVAAGAVISGTAWPVDNNGNHISGPTVTITLSQKGQQVGSTTASTSTNPQYTFSVTPIPGDTGQVTVNAYLPNSQSPNGSANTTEVGVKSIEYYDGKSWNNASTNVLCILNGQTVKYRANSDPAGTAWPPGNPVWSGMNGSLNPHDSDNSGGQTYSVTYTQLSPDTTPKSYQTVTVACGTFGSSSSALAVGLGVKSVSFSGSGYSDVKQDSGSQSALSAPHWVDNTVPMNGNASDASNKTTNTTADVNRPACFAAGSTGSVALSLAPTIAPNYSLIVPGGDLYLQGIAVSPSTIGMAPTKATVSGGAVNLAATSLSAPFGINPTDQSKQIGILSPMKIAWQYCVSATTPDKNTKWVAATTTDHKVYTPLGSPSGSQTFLTVLTLGCSSAAGVKSTDTGYQSTIVSDIFGAFTGRSVKRVSDGTVMTYWGPYAQANGVFTTDVLLAHADGRCGAWSDFLVNILGAQGVTSNKTTILPVWNNIPFQIPPGWQSTGYSYMVINQLPAQGSSTGNAPIYEFFDHAVVTWSGDSNIYDPSYGSIYSSKQAWHDHSLWGFEKYGINANGQKQILLYPEKQTDFVPNSSGNHIIFQ